MSDQFWQKIKSKYRLGELIHGTVEYQVPFGIFVSLDDEAVKGLFKKNKF
jgi:ribosomal protein S1